VETAHGRDALAGAAAGVTFRSFGALFEARAGTCVAFDERVDGDFFLDATGCVEEGDVGLDFDVFADENFFLEGVASATAAATASPSSTGEGAEEVLEVDVLGVEAAAEASAEGTAASEGVPAWLSSGVGVETARRVECC
jgi:hypothetical protein